MRTTPTIPSGGLRLSLQPSTSKNIKLSISQPMNTSQLNMQLMCSPMEKQLRTTPFETKEIILMFYKPSRDDAFQNKLVAFFDGPYCHVEIGFVFNEKLKDDKGDVKCSQQYIVGSSIYNGRTVFCQRKNYERTGYVSIGLRVTPSQFANMLRFCQDCAQRQIGFDQAGMYLSYVSMGSGGGKDSSSANKTFCSKYVTEVLKVGGVEAVCDLDPSSTTPSKLYRHVQASLGKVITVTPNRLQSWNESEAKKVIVQKQGTYAPTKNGVKGLSFF